MQCTDTDNLWKIGVRTVHRYRQLVENRGSYSAPRPTLKIKFLPHGFFFLLQPNSAASGDYCTVVQGFKKM